MKRIVTLCAITLLFPALSAAHEGATGIVKERMDVMEGMAAEIKAINRSVEANRNLSQIADRAAAIRATSRRIPALFPQGSLDAPTTAKPAIWQEWDRFQMLAGDLGTVADALAAAAASGDPKRVAERAAAVNRACLSCHADYRGTR